MYKSLVWYTKLRYRLLPYIYSQAGDIYHKDATLMRGLMMDYPLDKMESRRKIKVRWIEGEAIGPVDFDSGVVASLDYEGLPLVVER